MSTTLSPVSSRNFMKILQLWGLSETLCGIMSEQLPALEYGQERGDEEDQKKSAFLLLESLQEGAEQTIFLEKALKCAARCCKSKLIGKSDYAGEFSGAVKSRL